MQICLLGDSVTQRLRGLADHWRNVFAWDDRIFVEQVQADQIDILLDLLAIRGVTD